MFEASFYRSSQYNFTGKITPGNSTSITVFSNRLNVQLGKLCGVTKRFTFFPACAVNLDVVDLAELADFVADLQNKFTGFGMLDEEKLPRAEFTPAATLQEIYPVQEITPAEPAPVITPKRELEENSVSAKIAHTAEHVVSFISPVNIAPVKIYPVRKATAGNSSKGVACKCGGAKKDKMKNWELLQYKCNYSAFNGGNFTASEWSQVTCHGCGNTWRTKLPYVEQLVKQKQTA